MIKKNIEGKKIDRNEINIPKEDTRDLIAAGEE